MNANNNGTPVKDAPEQAPTRTMHSAVQITRHIIQLIAFVLLPGVFISTYSAIKDVYIALIGGTFSATALASQLWLLAAILPITILAGRFFCGFLCAFGSMGDFLWFLSRKAVPHRKSIDERADRILKLLKYVVLVGSIVSFWTLGLSISSTADPWTIFGMYASVTGWPSFTNHLSIGAGLLLIIIIGSLFIERFFCRYLCPLGAIFAILSRLRLFRIKKPRKNCGNCKLCTAKCSMGIPLYQSDSVQSGECINCFQCTTACPRGNAKTTPKPAVAAAMSVAAMTGLYYAGNLLHTDATTTSPTPAAASEFAAQGQYTDGVYQGSATGYKGNTTVQVTVQNGNIAGIEVLSTGDDEQFFSRAKDTVISSILAGQSTNVDSVSGATFSSNGIIDAVENALQSAGGTQTGENPAANHSIDNSTSTDSATAEITDNASAADTSPSDSSGSADSADNPQDGTYTGTGSGFRGDITVKVTVIGGEITNITVVSYQDDAPYFSRAEEDVIPAILSSQTTTVDAVSGATFSSNGIMAAVSDALNISFDNPNAAISQEHSNTGRKERNH